MNWALDATWAIDPQFRYTVASGGISYTYQFTNAFLLCPFFQSRTGLPIPQTFCVLKGSFMYRSILTAFATMLVALQFAVSSARADSGLASYYGYDFAGKSTASGETFNPGAMTAASLRLPFGTLVRVTNRRTGRSVIVRINDRGSFVGGRIIDLSRGAATVIGIIGHGVASVDVEVAGSIGGTIVASNHGHRHRANVQVASLGKRHHRHLAQEASSTKATHRIAW